MKTIVMQLPRMGASIGNRPLRIGEFVPAAALTARRLTVEDLEDPTKLQSLYATQRAMQTTLGTALPLETDLKTGLTRRLHRINLEIARYEHTPEFELPTLDPMFLSWKTRAGFPAFSIFRLDSDTMTVSFAINEIALLSAFRSSGATLLSDLIESRAFDGKFSMTPAIPEFMAKYYLNEGLRKNLQARCNERRLQCIDLTAKYGGVMPESVRENVHKWSNVPHGQPRFDEILIVAEAPEESWQVKEIPRADPLVIGIAHKLLWLVDVFDLTPIEKFARDLCESSSKVSN